MDGVLFLSSDFSKRQQVEIIAAIRDASSLVPAVAIADGGEGDARRQGEGFLARGQRDVDAPVVYAQFGSQEAADGIDEEERVVVLIDRLADSLRIGLVTPVLVSLCTAQTAS